MRKRDPRVDPKAGDVLQGFGWMREGSTITVIRRDGDEDGSLVIIKPSSAKLPRRECLAFFRRAAVDAEVIRVAD